MKLRLLTREEFMLPDEVCKAQRDLTKKQILETLEEKKLLEVGRKAIEDALVEWRDNRLSEFNRGNGLVIRGKDGKDSSIIRFGPETALRIGIKAMWQALKEVNNADR